MCDRAMREQGRIAYKAVISATMGPWPVGGSSGWVNPLDRVLSSPSSRRISPRTRRVPAAQCTAMRKLSSVEEDQAHPSLLVVAWRALWLGCRDAVEKDVFQEICSCRPARTAGATEKRTFPLCVSSKTIIVRRDETGPTAS